MKITRGNRYRWRVHVRETGDIFEHDDIRAVIALAARSRGLGWHPPRTGAAPVRSPFLSA